jgi:hypothetical protein
MEPDVRAPKRSSGFDPNPDLRSFSQWLIFDGGHTMTATAAPAYLGNPANVDPEEAFVAAL